MKEQFKRLIAVVGCSGAGFIAILTADAATIYKADNTSNLNLGASWSNNVAPGTGDIGTWNHLVVNNTNSALGANLSWAGVKVIDPAGLITLAAGNSLTIGSSGVDLSLATSSLTFSNDVVLGSSQTWNVTNGQTLTVAGMVSGSKTLTITNGGTVVLVSSNSYSGGTTIKSGIVQPDTIYSFGAGSVTMSGGSILMTGFPASGIMTNAFSVSGTPVIDMAGRNASIVLNGAWSGSGTILVSNDTSSGSTLTFGGGTGGNMSGFTGAITVVSTNAAGVGSAGNLRFNNTSTENNTGSASASFNLGTAAINLQSRDSGTIALGELTGGAATSLDGNSGGSGTTVWSIGGKGTSTTFAGIIKDHAGTQLSAVTKVGGGTLTLTGPNTFSGLLTITAGTLQIGDGVTSGAGTLGSGAVTNSSVLLFARPDSLTVGNAISGTGNLVQAGDGVLTLSGANTYTGTTTVSNNGTILTGVAGAVPNGAALVLGGAGTAGTVDLSAQSLVAGSLNNGAGSSGAYIGNSAAAPASLIFNGTGPSSFSGSIQDALPSGGSSTVSLSVQAGKLTLNGASTYSGATVISGGTLALGAGGSISNSTAISLSGAAGLLDVSAVSGFSLSAGQSLSGIGAVNGNVSAANNTISPAGAGTAGVLSFSNNLALNGGNTISLDLSTTPASGNDSIIVAGVLNLSGVNTLQLNALSGTLVPGTYRLIRFGSLGSGGASNLQLAGNAGNGLQAALNVTTTEVDLVVSPGAGNTLVWQGDGGANLWDSISANWLLGAAPVDFGNGDFAVFNDSATNNIVNLSGALQPGFVTVNSTNNYTFTGAGRLSGAFSLTKTNTGTLIVATTNDYNGLTTIAQGALQLGDGVHSGNLGNSSVADGSRLLLFQPGASVLSNVVSGAGQLIQAGAGAVTLSASNSYGGGTTINAGTLLQAGAGGIPATGNVTNNGTLVLDSTGGWALGNLVQGTGGLVVVGSGTLIVSANNTYSGGTIVSNGMLQVGNSSGSGTGAGAVAVMAGGAVSGTGVIGGSLTINSGGVLSSGNLSGPLTVAGGLTVNSGGILNAQAGASTNCLAVGGNLNLSGTINVTNAPGLPDGVYPIITYGGSLAYAATLGSAPPGRRYAINTNTPGVVSAQIGHVPGGGSGTGAPVTVTDNGGTVTLNNGIVNIIISKSDAHISQMNYAGTNLLSGGSDGGEFYWSWNQPNYQNPAVTQYTLAQDPSTNGGTIAEVDLFSQWNGNSSTAALDVDIHYFMLRGSQGFYASAVNSHPASYPENPGGEFRMVCYNGTMFDWLSEESLHNRLMAPASTPWNSVSGAPQEFQLWTAGIYQGQYECKYEYSADYCDLNAWGFSSTTQGLGIWMTKPSQEYYSGGPMKRELICQDDQAGPGPIVLNMINGTHYTMGSDGDIKAGEAFSKTFGPWLIYANQIPAGTSNTPAILFADAQAQAAAEQSAWPFTWWSNPAYVKASGRGTVSGTINISDSGNPNAPAAGLWVGVAQQPPSSIGSADFQYWEKNLQFWAKSDAGGNFSISNVIAGTNYTLFAFGPGATGTFQSQPLSGTSFSSLSIASPPFSVTVTAGATNNLGTVTWAPARVGPTVWQIGVPDRSAHEFLHGTDWWLSDIGSSPTNPSPNWMKSFDFANDFPTGLVYTVGQSQWATGWNFAHTALGLSASSTETWKVLFNLPQAPANGAQASLYMGFAADYQGPVKVVLNGHTITSGTTPPSGNDDTMIRLGIHGVFSDVRLGVPAADLQAGQNEMDFTMTATGSVEKSAMYDYLQFELSSYVPPPPANLSATVSNLQVALSWAPMSGATSYVIRRSSSSNGTYSVVASNVIGPVVGSGVTTASYLDTGAPGGTNYYIVASANPNGSTNSSPLAVILPVTTAPQFVSRIVVNGMLQLSGSGGTPGRNYYLLTSTGISTPEALWTPILTNSFDGGGNFTCSAPLDANAPQRFYLIKVP
jgi:autotransporter-associated beta strand protein